jgi:hypothetical protein
MQTTGAFLLAVNRCSSARVLTDAQDSSSAHGLLYLAAGRADRRKEEHCQGMVDVESFACKTRPDCRLPSLNWGRG